MPERAWFLTIRGIDTGSSDLWLQSSSCVQCTGKTFDPASSSTLSNSSTPFSISYGIGSAQGTTVSDVVSIGSSGFTVQNQVWGLVSNNLGTPIPGDIAGIMGLGFKVSTSGRSCKSVFCVIHIMT